MAMMKRVVEVIEEIVEVMEDNNGRMQEENIILCTRDFKPELVYMSIEYMRTEKMIELDSFTKKGRVWKLRK